jgi:hypothetical protein
MTPLTVARANQIVDRISDIAQSGGYLRPVALSRVGASSTIEALAALYLVTAETFRTAALSNNQRNRDLLQEFVRAAEGTGMWIATQFHPEGQTEQPIGVDESARDAETIDSFVLFLGSLDPAASDYWSRVYSRIGIPAPLSEPQSAEQPSKGSWWRRVFG